MRSGFIAMLGALALFSSTMCFAQQETLTPKQAKALIVEDAYGKTTSARSEADFSEIISLCQRGLRAELSEDTETYGKELLSWALNRRGQARLDRGELQDAMADFDAAIENDASRFLAFHNRGYGYAVQGEFEKALADFNQTLRLKPNFAKAYINRGELYSVAGQWKEAIDDYTRALRVQPNDDELHTSRGHAYYQTGNYRNAVRDYNTALRLNPRAIETLIHRGDALLAAENLEGAASDYRLAISRAPDSPRAHLSIAWMMATSSDERFRNAEEALSSAQRALELLGEDRDEIRHRYLMVLAAAQANAGDFDAAVKSMNQALEVAPESFQAEYEIMLDSFQNKQPHRSGDQPEARTARNQSS